MSHPFDQRFIYHAPDENRQHQHEIVRRDMRSVAISWSSFLPEGREQSLAITKLEEAMFWANAAIARQGDPT